MAVCLYLCCPLLSCEIHSYSYPGVENSGNIVLRLGLGLETFQGQEKLSWSSIGLEVLNLGLNK